jgi:sigma-B regulation protein RsbU (phosphoserine phosphatase)
MEPSAAAAKREKTARLEYLEAFASTVGTLGDLNVDDLLMQVPLLAVEHFDAPRCELWLWDSGSDSGYLVHSAGVAAEHRHEYASAGKGVVGEAGASRQCIENASLASFGGEFEAIAESTGLNCVSAYPMPSGDKPVGVLVLYHGEPASREQLTWWRTYAEMCSVKVRELLTTQEQQRQITQLSLLFEATRLLNSTLDLSELLDLILKIARQETDADRGSVFLVDHQTKELWTIVASGLENQEIRLPFGAGVAGKVAESGEVINVADAYELPFFQPSFDQKTGYRTRSLLCLPVKHHSGEVVGVIQLLNKKEAPQFSKDDEEFLVKLSGHIAIAMENARLHRDALVKQRLEKELALARSIQRSLLPDAPPVVPGYELAVLNEPCYEVGGDYYDFLTLGPQSLLLVIADVEGKGVGSALVMSNLQATLRALVMHLHSLEVLALSLNEMMYNDTKSEKYLSCFLGLVDTRRGGLHYINCGHCPPILVSGKTGEYMLLEEGGTVVGLFPTAEYRRGSVNLNDGDVLICCTDGILEACDIQEQEYGKERLAACVAHNRGKNAQGIVDAVLEDVNRFSMHSKYGDDKVLMIMKVTTEGVTESARRVYRRRQEEERRDRPRGS